MKLRVLNVAEHEATVAAFWYDDQRIGLGDDFLVEYAHRLNQIEESPGRFAFLETNETEFKIRRAILRRFPYGIVYQILSDEVVALAVMHLSRRPNYWIHRLK